MKSPGNAAWPELPAYAAWADTCDTLHMWTQVVGKIRLSTSPWVNHSWGSALYVTAHGLTTSPMPFDAGAFSIDFDLVDHELRIATSAGGQRNFSLQPMTVADFYRQVMDALRSLGIDVKIFTRPVEVADAIRFEDDEQHASYDAGIVSQYFHALMQVDRVFKAFRAEFIGKASPVHFFWGAFDLAATRFSGQPAPLYPGGAPNCADWVMQEAYSHELVSAGFWPGAGSDTGEAAFYAYAYPEPAGYRDSRIEPAAAYYSGALGEYILPYAAVQAAADPERALHDFLETTYVAAADRAGWDRTRLERNVK